MPDHTKKKKKKKKSGLFDRLREMGRNLKSTLTAPQRRFEKSRKTTVSDLQKRRIKDTSDMSDAQKMRTRTKTDMSDEQKGDKSRQPTKSKTVSDMQKKRGGTSSVTVQDEQKQITQTMGAIPSEKKKLARQQAQDKTMKAKADSMKDRSIKAAKAKAGTGGSKAESKEPSTFKEAFRMARKEGKAKFTFKGKSYAAVTMDEVKKAKKQGKIEKATLGAYLRMMKKRKK